MKRVKSHLGFGIESERVSEMIMPSAAIALVNRYITALPPQEWVTVPKAAALLSVSQSKITTWIREGRLTATNVASKSKRQAIASIATP